MIKIDECVIAGYPARTEQNVICSDLTFAFAVDFYTGGEVLTKHLCDKYKKPIISIDFNNKDISDTRMNRVVNKINSLNIKNIFGTNEVVVNVAGNGIYRMQESQDFINEWTRLFFEKLVNHPAFKLKIVLVRSGGQTGFDEAGVIAAAKLGIQALVLAPKGYLFRIEQGKDISNKYEFEERFKLSI